MSISRQGEISWEAVTDGGYQNRREDIVATVDGIKIGEWGTIPWSEIDEARAVATKKSRLDIFNEQYEAAVRLGAELTGLCTVRDAISFMFDKKYDINQLYYQHDGKDWTVELRVVGVNEIGNAIGETVTGSAPVTTGISSSFTNSENPSAKTCISCANSTDNYFCKVTVNPIDGELSSCFDARRSALNVIHECIPVFGKTKACGLDGNLWEPKQ